MGCFWSDLFDDDSRYVQRTPTINRSSYNATRVLNTRINDYGEQYNDPLVRVNVQSPHTNRLENENNFYIIHNKTINRVNSEQSRLHSDIQRRILTNQQLQKQVAKVKPITQNSADRIDILKQNPASIIKQCNGYLVKPNVEVKRLPVTSTEPLRHCIPRTKDIVTQKSVTSNKLKSESGSSSKVSKINTNKTSIGSQFDNPSNIDTPKYGSYVCKKCGRWWYSRLGWQEKYQVCKKCKEHVYPGTLKELPPWDLIEDEDDNKPHEVELCEMCQKLGYHCRFYNKVYKRQFLGHNNRQDKK